MIVRSKKNESVYINFDCNGESIATFDSDEIYCEMPYKKNDWLVLFDADRNVIGIVDKDGVKCLTDDYELEV